MSATSRDTLGRCRSYTGGLYRIVKYAVFALLAVNLIAYGWRDSEVASTVAAGLLGTLLSFGATIDSIAWFGLLLSFEWETGSEPIDENTRARRIVRTVCYIGIALALVAYWPRDGDPTHRGDYTDWLDFFNVIAWVWVVVLLEIDLRIKNVHKDDVTAPRTLISVSVGVAKIVVYTVLVVIALAWGFAEEWLALWDSFLWLFAFTFIEMNVLKGGHNDSRALAKS